MQFSRLKELVRRLGGVLVLDGEKPEFVILSYDKYENIEAGGEEVPFSTVRRNGLSQSNSLAGRVISTEEEQESVERLNQEISALKEEIRQKEEAELVENKQSAEPIAEIVDFD